MKTAIITSTNVSIQQKLLNDWNIMLQSHNSPYALYSSPFWFDAVQSLDPSKYLLGISESDSNIVESIIPFELNDKKIAFSIKRINIFSYKFACAYVMGGEPIGDATAEKYDEIFQQLFSRYPKLEAIFFKCLQEENSFFKRIHYLKKYIHFVEREPSKFTFIKFNDTFDEYLLNFNKKERYNLKRQCRIALEVSEGKLRLERITETSQIDHFIESGKYVINNSWKSNTDEKSHIFSKEKNELYKSLAKNKLFRSYLLIAEDEPWAFVLGYHHRDIFHYSNIAYNEKYSNLSPGTVLFYQMIEDLYAYEKPRILNFGIGDSQYKRRFGTDSFTSSDIIIFKKNLKNSCSVKLLSLMFMLKKLLFKLHAIIRRNK